MEAPTVNMHDNFSAMQEDRLIKIYIGDEPQPLLVAQSVLLRTSNYFRGALFRGFEESNGILRRPDDDLTAWKILAFWMTEKELPLEDVDDDALIKAWYLADYFTITQLQDDIMCELIDSSMEDALEDVSDYLKYFSFTRPGTLPRKLYAESLMNVVRHHLAVWIRWKDLTPFQENSDCAADILAAAIALDDYPDHWSIWCVLVDPDKDGRPVWLRYMMGTQGSSNMSKYGWTQYSDERGWQKTPLARSGVIGGTSKAVRDPVRSISVG